MSWWCQTNSPWSFTSLTWLSLSSPTIFGLQWSLKRAKASARLMLFGSANDRFLLAEKERRARQVDELSFVLQKRETRGLTGRRAAGGLHIVQTLPPQLGHAVIHFRRVAA